MGLVDGQQVPTVNGFRTAFIPPLEEFSEISCVGVR